MSKLLTINEVAARFRVSTRTIQRWVKDGKFPRPIRPGGKPLWSEKDLDLYIDSGSIHAYRHRRRA